MEPQLAWVNSDAGGYAFATYFMAVLDWSIATNDGWLIKKLSGQDCRACQRYLAEIDGLHKRHEVQHGGRIAIRASHPLGGALPYGEVAFEYVLDEDAILVLPSKKSSPATKGIRLDLYLVWSISDWEVREVSVA